MGVKVWCGGMGSGPWIGKWSRKCVEGHLEWGGKSGTVCVLNPDLMVNS